MAKAGTRSASNSGSSVEGTDGISVAGDSRSDSTLDAIANSGIGSFDPSDLGNGNGSAKSEPSPEPVKRGRGRPAGSGNRKPTQKSQDVSVSGTEKLLLGIHNALAIGLKCEELALEDKDAKLLAESIGNVSSHYQSTIDPKTLAWLGLAGVLGAIYVPRVIALINSRKRDKKDEQRPRVPEQPSNVMEFNPSNFGMQQ